MHHCEDDGPHPLDGVDIVVAGSAGDGFMRHMKKRGAEVLLTGETDPAAALTRFSRRRSPARSAFRHNHRAMQVPRSVLPALMVWFSGRFRRIRCRACRWWRSSLPEYARGPKYRWPANAGRRARGTCNGKRSRRLSPLRSTIPPVHQPDSCYANVCIVNHEPGDFARASLLHT